MRGEFTMAKTPEERYPGTNHVHDLQSFLWGKIFYMKKLLATGKAKDSVKVQNFISMVYGILQLECFEADINVYTLMKCLKEETQELDKEREQWKEKIRSVEQRIREEQSKMYDTEYSIPDEMIEFVEAERACIAQMKFEKLRYEEMLGMLEREKDLINNLKGIICRPKGFFENL